MFQQVQDQVQRRADLLLAGQFEDMSRDYLFPLPVYLEHHMIALRTRAEGIARAAGLRNLLQMRQIERLTITVRAVEVPRDGRFRVWADWHAVSGSALRSRQLGLVYYMRDTRHGYRSEMLHYSCHTPRAGRAVILPQQQRA